MGDQLGYPNEFVERDDLGVSDAGRMLTSEMRLSWSLLLSCSRAVAACTSSPAARRRCPPLPRPRPAYPDLRHRRDSPILGPWCAARGERFCWWEKRAQPRHREPREGEEGADFLLRAISHLGKEIGESNSSAPPAASGGREGSPDGCLGTPLVSQGGIEGEKGKPHRVGEEGPECPMATPPRASSAKEGEEDGGGDRGKKRRGPGAVDGEEGWGEELSREATVSTRADGRVFVCPKIAKCTHDVG